MKIYNKILVLALLAIGLTSCLKDRPVEDQKYGMINLNANKIIEIPAGSSRSQTFSLPIQSAPQSVNTTIHLAAESAATEDVTVTLSLAESQTLLTAYNTANSTNYTLLPQSLYTLPNGLNVTIPKGEKDATFAINVSTQNFDPSKTYAIFVKVAMVDKSGYTISGNYGYKMLIIGVKNAYDGIYTLTGVFVDASNLRVGRYPKNVSLETVDGNTVLFYDLDNKTNAWYYTNPTTGNPAWGGWGIQMTFDPTTKKVVSLVDPYAGTSFPLTLDSSFDSKYDPATKTIVIKYKAGTRFTITDTYTYVKPR